MEWHGPTYCSKLLKQRVRRVKPSPFYMDPRGDPLAVLPRLALRPNGDDFGAIYARAAWAAARMPALQHMTLWYCDNFVNVSSLIDFWRPKPGQVLTVADDQLRYALLAISGDIKVKVGRSVDELWKHQFLRVAREEVMVVRVRV